MDGKDLLLTVFIRQARQQVGDLADRLDFAERLLAQKRGAERLAPPRSS